MQSYKNKTFLYYFDAKSIVWKIPAIIKVIIYLILNIFILFHNSYLLNLLISIVLFLILIAVGFVRYRVKVFKLLGISLFLFFILSFVLEVFTSSIDITKIEMLRESVVFILGFCTKWLLINMSGLLMFTLLSQDELITLLMKARLDFRIIISITIAFNLVTRLLETIEEINISLNSRGIKGKHLINLFNKAKYIFSVILLDNVEYISSLRATYAFDYQEIKKVYGK